MARIATVSKRTDRKPSRLTRPRRALAFLMLGPTLSACQTMERMDFWDQFFEARPRPGPVVAMEPIAGPADHAAAPGVAPPPGLVRAMEPISNPADHQIVARRSPQPTPRSEAEPRRAPAQSTEPDAEARTRQLVRQNPWVTRFWMELTPAQQARVERQLNHGGVRSAAGGAEAPAIWDPMGLADRVALVFGRGSASEPPGPPAGRRG